jgi:hypothetical protein
MAFFLSCVETDTLQLWVGDGEWEQRESSSSSEVEENTPHHSYPQGEGVEIDYFSKFQAIEDMFGVDLFRLSYG